MSASTPRRLIGLAAIVLIIAQIVAIRVSDTRDVRAASTTIPAFHRVWSRTDQPIASGKIARTWMWGPEAVAEAHYEPYTESPGGQRLVQYFDKSRMEITQPGAPDDGLWFVTNGLLVVEMVTGQRQIGDAAFEPRSPANVNVAGDADDPSGPTYESFGHVLNLPPTAEGSIITARLGRDGNVTVDPQFAGWNATAAVLDDVTRHTIAAPFWAFMTAEGLVSEGDALVQAPLFVNPYYATGRPISEAYWATVRVGGTAHDVLMQCFERRCLTWTPTNPTAWQTEAGNVGRHYLDWLAGQTPTQPGTATMVPTPSPDCDPAYPSVCIAPPPPDLNCADIPYGNFTVLPPDPHGFDPDKDGIGCKGNANAPTATSGGGGGAQPTATKSPTPTRTPSPTPTATVGPQHGDGWFTDGTWNVGEDIAAGTYRNTDSSAGCHWERLASLSSVIVENLAHTVQEVTIAPGDAYFRSESCGTWNMTAAYPTPTPVGGTGGEAACLSGIESEVLQLLNAARLDAGLSPLASSRALNVSAYTHSLDMTTRDYYNMNTLAPLPTGQSGPTPVDRMRDAGYPFPATGWAAGENIAWGYTNAQTLVNAWMGSQSYREKILNPLFTQVGIGTATNPDAYYQNVWVTDFGNGNDGPGC